MLHDILRQSLPSMPKVKIILNLLEIFFVFCAKIISDEREVETHPQMRDVKVPRLSKTRAAHKKRTENILGNFHSPAKTKKRISGISLIFGLDKVGTAICNDLKQLKLLFEREMFRKSLEFVISRKLMKFNRKFSQKLGLRNHSN